MFLIFRISRETKNKIMKLGDHILASKGDQIHYSQLVGYDSGTGTKCLGLLDTYTGEFLKTIDHVTYYDSGTIDYFDYERLIDGYTVNRRSICVTTAASKFLHKLLKEYKEDTGKENKDLNLMVKTFELIARENGAQDWKSKKQFKKVNKGLDLFREKFLHLWW